MSITIKTRRLVLRAPAVSDLDRLLDGIGNYEVAKFLTPVLHPYRRADGEQWLASFKPGDNNTSFAIDLDGEDFVGCIRYESELGYWIAERFWGRGLMTEAARAIIQWKFEDPGVSQLKCGAHVDNVASMRVQEKLGFITTGRRTVFARARQAEVDQFDTTLNRAAFLVACQRLDAMRGV